MYMNIKFYGL